ncbi:hypothetical protein B6U80_02165 [Candidatus Pacearchaeota archaeon ex4484_26]|nr:MAG: hypothetical protein B6U80_02165 [Candidatus Pacearchaeota archaeon ex4484_26]
MIKLFGFLDFASALVLLLVFLKVLTPIWLVLAAGYLVIKGWVFLITSKDIASIIDLGVGLLIFIFIFAEMPVIVFIVLLIWLIQKAAFSFI